jgi:hypothetical protein
LGYVTTLVFAHASFPHVIKAVGFDYPVLIPLNFFILSSRLTEPVLVVDFASHRPLLWFGDLTWYSSGVLFWHLAENAVGLLGACMPSFAPLVKGRLHGPKSSSNNTQPGRYSTVSSKKLTPLSPFDERVDSQTLLSRTAGGRMTDRGFEEHQLESMPHTTGISGESRGKTSSVGSSI